jgi:hypothetical protein
MGKQVVMKELLRNTADLLISQGLSSTQIIVFTNYMYLRMPCSVTGGRESGGLPGDCQGLKAMAGPTKRPIIST